VKPRFEVYKAVSEQIREIFADHTPIIEPLSLDEAYLDVTENLQSIPLAGDVAFAIRAKTDERLSRRSLGEGGPVCAGYAWRMPARQSMAKHDIKSPKSGLFAFVQSKQQRHRAI
jgi:impB/mucB/samB family